MPRTLEDLHLLGSRQEGHICELRGPPNYKTVHGFIEVPSIGEKLFFHESVSGIQKRALVNYRLGAKVQFSVDKREKGFFAKELFIELPETKQVQCKCGWEDSVGKGIQEGFVGVLFRESGYGFITKDFPRDRKPTGCYFHETELQGYPIMQLNIGDRVHFVVGQNDKGCVAQKIDVQGKTQFGSQGSFTTSSSSVVPQGSFPSTSASFDPRLMTDMFLVRQSSPQQFSHMGFPSSPTSNRPPMRHPMSNQEDWQNVTRRKK